MNENNIEYEKFLIKKIEKGNIENITEKINEIIDVLNIFIKEYVTKKIAIKQLSEELKKGWKK